MSNTFDKLSVLDSFIEEVNSYLPEIETNIERLTQSPGDMDALKETYRCTHTIGGSASMMDFPGLAHVAHGMEDVLGDALDGLVTLDELSLGLLHRSLGRLRQLLEGIHNGIDEEAVIAEDDADYARYRATVESGGMSASSEMPISAAQPQISEGVSNQNVGSFWAAESVPSFSNYDERSGNGPLATPLSSPAPSPSLTPSFDEVLASFRTPSLSPGEEVVWPEDPIVARLEQSVSNAENGLRQETTTPEVNISEPSGLQATSGDMSWLGTAFPSYEKQETPLPPAPQVPGGQSAFDTLMASTRRPVSEPDVSSITSSLFTSAPGFVSGPPASIPSPSEKQGAGDILPSIRDQVAAPLEETPESYHAAEVLSPSLTQQPVALSPSASSWTQRYGEAQQDAGAVEEQAQALKTLVEQLRESMTIIEEQRKEFRGFLDGSKDALDRMEEWAGQAMGLNLRQSPEQVRRYLPLSVMWVASSKLKKVFDLLEKITGGVKMTDEQIVSALRQLQTSLQACDEAFQQAGSARSQAPGWTPWEMQVSQDAANLRERVTFERQGDLAALRAEMESSLREEIKHEYEQRIRNEVRQEFEDRLLHRQEGSTTEAGYELHDLEARLRRELEIQVRQELLSQLAQSGNVVLPGMPLNEQAHEEPAGSTHGTVNLQMGLPTEEPAAPVSQIPPPLPARQSSTTASFASDFGEEAAEIFRMEAEEHLQNIGTYVAALEKDPHNRELIQGIRRATHTLKGAAGMMGFRLIADLSHISEDLLDTIMEGTMAISPAVLSIILDTAETLDLLIAGRGEPVDDEARVRVLQVRYTELLGERSSAFHHDEEDLLDLDETDLHHQEYQVSGMLSEDAENETGVNVPRANKGDLTVRVRLQRLDELVTLFGEVLVNRSVLEERLQRLVRLVSDVTVSSNRLRDVGQKLESRFEAATLPSGRSVQVMPGEGNQRLLPGGPPVKAISRGSDIPSHLAEFDELELDRYTEFHQLARGLSEGISDMTTLSTEMDAIIRECEGVFARENRLNTQFQDRLMKTRLVPLSQLTPRLYRAARAVSLKQQKEMEFVREGEATEVDRTVFEEIGAPLLHLVRNAVNHALETPEERIRKGKSPIGQVKFSAAYEGNQIVIAVTDDGRGLDREQIRQTAISRGLIRADQQLSEGDFVSLIFHPGFSTAAFLSEESGRGVGLDVVRDTVSRLRGTIVVESAPDQGTTFTMTFPTSLAIQRAMMVRVGSQQFAVPTVHVESIGRFDNFKHTTQAGRPAVLVRNDPYPLQMLSQYLSLPNTGIIEEKAQLLLVNAGGHRVALVIDEIKGQSDIVMKNLGPHLRQVHGIAGATVLGNGLVVLVLELNNLLSGRPRGSVALRGSGATAATPAVPARRERDITPQAVAATSTAIRQQVDMAAGLQGQRAGTVRPAQGAAVPQRGKHILVVDDSPSVRRVVSNMLKQRNWEVQMARDGVEALEMITYEAPAAVLLDIEMPRMDGYELISTVRAQEQFRTLPLIVLTSRAATKHQQRAMSLGASAYVVKPYQDEELLSTINSLVFGTESY